LENGPGFATKPALLKAIKLCNLREKLECFSIPVFVRALDLFLRAADQTHDDETAKILQLFEAARSLHQDDPRLHRLGEIVTDFVKTSPQSKIIVFCSCRAIVEVIVEHLNSIVSEIRAMAFMGQAQSAELKGQNQGQQIRIMDLFRQGRFDVIVSTSIGEEGLDICEVDLIICYGVQRLPIHAIQRMRLSLRSAI
jgi:ERCC4-related helicase